MAYLLNEDIHDNTRIFDQDKSNINHDMQYDIGNMNKEIEDNMQSLAIAAKTSLSQRKPIYDFKTSNKSFIELYNDLFHLGIKNNKFFLKLYDTDLIGVDPYQKIMPIELQMKIILECIINPWYFLREVCRIPEDGSPIEVGGGTRYQIDRNNTATWYLYLNGIDHYSSKPRQCGKTHDALAKCNYTYHFGTMSSTFLFFNKEQSLAKTNLYRMKCQRDMMPQWMQMKITYLDDGTVDKGVDNMTTMRNPVTSNTIIIKPKATSKENAMKIARGDTGSFHHYDELDFTPHNIDIINTAAFAYSKASENAFKNHSLAGRVFSSTPNRFSRN